LDKPSRRRIQSDPALFSSKEEQICHELKEVKTMEQVIRSEMKTLQYFHKSLVRKIETISDEMDMHIYNKMERKEE